jgi:hypothetical protein
MAKDHNVAVMVLVMVLYFHACLTSRPSNLRPGLRASFEHGPQYSAPTLLTQGHYGRGNRARRSRSSKSMWLRMYCWLASTKG